jgi:hypothetical protein
MNRIAHFIEMIAFSSRWLVAPFLLGLIFGLAVLLWKFVVKLVDFVTQVHGAETSDAIVGILKGTSNNSGSTRYGNQGGSIVACDLPPARRLLSAYASFPDADSHPHAAAIRSSVTRRRML